MAHRKEEGQSVWNTTEAAGTETDLRGKQSSQMGSELVQTQVGEEQDAAPRRETAAGPLQALRRLEGGARGKPHCPASTKCHPRARSSHVLSTPRLSALPRPRAGIGALAFGLEGMLVATMTLAGSPGAGAGANTWTFLNPKAPSS